MHQDKKIKVPRSPVFQFNYFHEYESKSNAEIQKIVSNSCKIFDTLVTGMVSTAGSLNQVSCSPVYQLIG